MSYPIDNSMAGLNIGAIGSGSGLSILDLNSNTNPFNNITITSGSGLRLSTSRNIKKYEVLETNEDILVVSAVWYRMRKSAENYVPRPSSLTDSILFDRITSEDRELAKEIRDYYSKKLMMFTLREQKLTSFRKDLNAFIHSDGMVFKEIILPLVYRLPEFYEYDTEFDVMVTELTKQFIEPSDRITNQRLTPLKKLIVKHKSGKFNEYWLKDSQDRMYKLDIPLDNKLAHLWNHFFEQGNVPIKGYFKYTVRDNVNYFHIKNWELDFSSL